MPVDVQLFSDPQVGVAVVQTCTHKRSCHGSHHDSQVITSQVAIPTGTVTS